MLSRTLLTMLVVAPLFLAANAFLVPSTTPKSIAFQTTTPTTTAIFAKKPKEDLSYIESRDMTRDEMIELNKKNEDIMNMELSMMTAFSLVLSLPILYLCWVAFFSE